MPARRGDVEHLLEHILGFRRAGGGHRFFFLEIDGKIVARTETSHGATTIGDDLLATMARQIHVSPGLFKGLLAGTKKRSDYLMALEQQGLLQPRK